MIQFLWLVLGSWDLLCFALAIDVGILGDMAHGPGEMGSWLDSERNVFA